MKNASLLIIVAIFALSCKKSESYPVINPLASQLAGSWIGVKKVINYTDKQGASQVFNSGATFGYEDYRLDGIGNYALVARFASGISDTLKGTYAVAIDAGKNYISFADNGAAIVDRYEIISLADHLLVLKQYQGYYFGIASNAAIGTNAVLNIEYRK